MHNSGWSGHKTTKYVFILQRENADPGLSWVSLVTTNLDVLSYVQNVEPHNPVCDLMPLMYLTLEEVWDAMLYRTCMYFCHVITHYICTLARRQIFLGSEFKVYINKKKKKLVY